MGNDSEKITWISWLKGIAVVCAFLAFCISIRQKEFERFSAIKPIFEITSNKAKKEFILLNYGGIVFFIGGKGSFELAPRQFTALPNVKDQKKKIIFILKDKNSKYEAIYLYWRDVDLNTYKMKIGINGSEYFIDDVPMVKRSDKYYTMSWHWLDWLFNCIFKKEWFIDYEVPKDKDLVIDELVNKKIQRTRDNRNLVFGLGNSPRP